MAQEIIKQEHIFSGDVVLAKDELVFDDILYNVSLTIAVDGVEDILESVIVECDFDSLEDADKSYSNLIKVLKDYSVVA